MTTKKKLDEPSVVDQMAEDANPPEYPPGAPELKSFLDLYPRSRRAEFKRKAAEFREWQEKLSAAREAGVLADDTTELTPEQQQARMNAAADADDMFDLMDQLMGMCAADPVVYRVWSRQVSDDELSKVFAAFMVRSQPGEVSSSTS